MENDVRLDNLCYTGYEFGKKFDANVFKSEKIDKIRVVIRENLVMRKTINRNTEGSYQLKHAVERLDKTKEVMEMGGYVSNGELIYAMILEGFDVERDGRNAWFNITSRSAEKFCNRFRR